MFKFIQDNIAYVIIFAMFIWFENSWFKNAHETSKERGALQNYIDLFTCVERCIKDSFLQYQDDLSGRQQFRFECMKPCYRNVFLPNLVYLE